MLSGTINSFSIYRKHINQSTLEELRQEDELTIIVMFFIMLRFYTKESFLSRKSFWASIGTFFWQAFLQAIKKILKFCFTNRFCCRIIFTVLSASSSMDRVPDYESVGWRFESSLTHQEFGEARLISDDKPCFFIRSPFSFWAVRRRHRYPVQGTFWRLRESPLN